MDENNESSSHFAAISPGEFYDCQYDQHGFLKSSTSRFQNTCSLTQKSTLIKEEMAENNESYST
jgi:hypothetical protein